MRYPELLFFLIPLGILYFFIKQRAQTIDIHPKLIISNSHLKESGLTLVAALIIIALARPVMKLPTQTAAPLTPLFIAIDLSNSMLAEDIKPNRLQKALSLAHTLIDSTHRKIALIVFTQNPLLIAPPTNDKAMLHMALNSIEAQNILTKGTNFQKLLDFVHQFDGQKDLVIFSDGGDFQNLHTYKDITIYAVGIGTKSGALIPTGDGYLKQDSKLVVTKLNEHFFTLAKDYSINQLKNFDFSSTKKEAQKSRYFELFFIPLFIALLLFLHIYTTLFETILHKSKALLPLLLIGYLHASMLDEYKIKKGYELYRSHHYKEALDYFDGYSLESLYAKAKTYQKLGNYPKAIELFKSIKTKDLYLKSRIHQDIAACYEKMKKYDAAREAYIEAMRLTPNNELLSKIKALAFKHNAKKQLLPFSKQKRVKKQSKSGKQSDKKKSKKSSSRLATAGGAQSAKTKEKSHSISKAKTMPLSSKVYDLINKGYSNEKNPW